MNSSDKEPLLLEPSPEASNSDTSLTMQQSTPNPKPHKFDKLNKPPRKRSRIACTWCRDRKVRCDAASHGVPCTNCELDQQQCVVHSASLNTRAKKPTSSRRQPYPSPTPSTLKASVFQHVDKSSRSPLITHTWNEAEQMQLQAPWTTPPHSAKSPQAQTISSVSYTFYTFLSLPGLSEIPQEDVQYLILKGCFCVPTGEVLDEFVRKYFLYVHPCLPIIDEAEFWGIYYQNHDQNQQHQAGSTLSDSESKSINLFTFQAMLFASSAFVSPATIKAAGFPDARVTRSILYTRAKLLYDLLPPRNPLYTIQAALLLSQHIPPTNVHTGATWLSIAIQNAIVYNALPPTHGSDTDKKAINMKKRVWWCILLRDRIMALGLRRAPLVAGDTMGLGMGVETVLGENDLEGESGKSEVYDRETKKLLGRVLGVLCEFVSVLGRVLTVLHSSHGSTIGASTALDQLKPTQNPNRAPSQSLRQHIAECKSALLRWSTNAKGALGAVVNSHMTHESVGLFFGLTFLYYHAARLALSNSEAVTLHHSLTQNTNTATDPKHKNKSQETNLQDMYDKIKFDLEDSTGCMTDTIKRFLAQGVAHHLPIDTTTLIAHPLLLSALDTKLSLTKSQSATRKRRFRYYATLMQVYQSRYEGTDTVAGFIQRTLQVADLVIPRATSPTMNAVPENTGKGGDIEVKSVNSWSSLFGEYPGVYLRLSMALDMAFRRGWYPGHEEIYGILGDEREGATGGRELDFMVLRSNTGLSTVDIGHEGEGGDAGGLGLGLGSLNSFLDPDGRIVEEQQQPLQAQLQPLRPMAELGVSAGPTLDPLAIPAYNPMMGVEYAYPAQLSATQPLFAHGQQNYGCGMYDLCGQGVLNEKGSPEFLNFGSSGSEGYSDAVTLPLSGSEEACVS
ncbi:hypothetical protein BJY04DRAFT_214214 [Aspergillus karnatakaensis]|uniref:Zn(II)2Cys6 transcription factor n=1 Tax=Aspergillus karnatakaensis TaxID=1810916 RepID=UPI003CCCD391